MTPARHADLARLIARARDLDALHKLERVAGHEFTPDLVAALAGRVAELKRATG